MKADRLKNEEFDFDMTDQLQPIGQALFDDKNQPDFNAFVQTMVTRKHWSDAILFATLFLDDANKAKVLGLYLRQFYQRKSPFYALLLVLTGNADKTTWDSEEHKWMLENWKVQVALILASFSQLHFHANRFRNFFETLAD